MNAEEVGIELMRQVLRAVPKPDDPKFDRVLLQAAEALMFAGAMLAEGNRGGNGEGLRLAERVGQRVRLLLLVKTNPQ
jgi:hypothetical protein